MNIATNDKAVLPATEVVEKKGWELPLEQEIAIAAADRPDREPSFPPLRSWPGMAVMCWVLATLVGSIGLCGLLGSIPFLASFGESFIPIPHSSAVLLITLGFSMVFYVCGVTRGLAKPMAGTALIFTGVFSLLKVTEFFGGAQFGIENIFHLHPGRFGAVLTGRMSPVAAAIAGSVSLSLFLLVIVSDQRQRAIRWAAYLTCAAGVTAFTVLLGYCYGTPLLYGGSVIPMALPEALGFIFLQVGIVIAIGPLHPPLRPLMGNSAHAQLLRAFLPITLVAVVLNGFLSQALPDSLRTNGAVISALTAVVILLITTVVVSRVALVLGHTMEVAEAKNNEAREQLREQARLLDLAPDAIFTMGLDGKIHFCNQSATKLFGWTFDEVLDKDSFQLIFKSGAVQKVDVMRTLEEKGEYECESQESTKDNSPMTVQTRFSVVRGGGSKPVMVLAVCRDVTAKKELEGQKLRSERLQSIGTLASGIAHDVNNALLPIVFCAEMLKRDPADLKRENFLDQILKNCERVRAIMKQILLFVGGGEVGAKTVNMVRMLKDTDQILQHTLPKTIDIKIQNRGDLWSVIGDETQLSQVFMNLCINARDAMGEKGMLTITAENVVVDETQAKQYRQAKPGPHVKLMIADTGCGIPTHVLDKIFDPFFTTKELGKGTGLGLSTVLGIVESHRGFLAVHSQVNQGTRFEIWLPAADIVENREIRAETTEAPRGNGETVLVVDDEADIRKIATEVLLSNGYEVLQAADGTEAVALFAQFKDKIGAVLCDMMMPVMDGTTTIRALKKIGPHVPMIAMSGLIEERATSAKTAGASAMLQKPFTASTLLTTVAQLIAESRSVAAA